MGVADRQRFEDSRKSEMVHRAPGGRVADPCRQNQADLERDLAIAHEEYGVLVPRDELLFGQVIGLVNVVGVHQGANE